MMMALTGTRIWMQPVPWRNRVEVFVIDHRPDDNFQPYLLVPKTSGKFQYEKQPEGFGYGAPTFSLHPDSVQQLFDHLWVSGFRPTEKINETSRLAATEAHLQDMRAIVASKLNITLPQEKPHAR